MISLSCSSAKTHTGVLDRFFEMYQFADPVFKAFLAKGVPHFSQQENFILRTTDFWRG
jgi:hypothetical protein